MKSLALSVTLALLSLLAAGSGRADGPSTNGAFLVAPQLAIARDGPVTATFLGSSQPFLQMLVGWEMGGAAGFEGFFFGSPPPAAGAEFERTLADHLSRPLPTGADLVFATRFDTGNGFAISATGASPRMAGFLSQPAFEGEPFQTVLLNAGVVRLSSDTVLVGFNPPGFALPTGFDRFAVRISLSNICVR